MSDRLSERRISFVRDGSNLKEFSRCRPFLPKNRRWHPENITLIECYEMSVLQNVCCWREADIWRNTARRRHYDGAILAHLSLGRFVCARGATQCSWRLTQDTHEALTHPLGICEANSARDRFKRLPAVLHHPAGGLYPQAVNGLRRGHPRRSDKSSPELPHAQVSDPGQICDR